KEARVAIARIEKTQAGDTSLPSPCLERYAAELQRLESVVQVPVRDVPERQHEARPVRQVLVTDPVAERIAADGPVHDRDLDDVRDEQVVELDEDVYRL